MRVPARFSCTRVVIDPKCSCTSSNRVWIRRPSAPVIHGKREHREQGEERELGLDGEHEAQREEPADCGVHQVHDRRTRRHAHGAQVVRQARHQLPGARAPVIRRVERQEVLQQVVAQVEFDAARERIQELPHAVAEEPSGERNAQHHRRHAPRRAQRPSLVHAVYPPTEQ